jgi:hypothetical protein
MENIGQTSLSSQVQQVQRDAEDMAKRRTSGPGKKKLIIFLVLLILCGIGGFLVFKGVTNRASEGPSPSPSLEATPFESETPVPEATTEPTTERKVDKKTVTIKVLNGTGIPKESGFLQTKLASLGYTKITVGNADSSDNSDAVVTFADDLPKSITEDITTLLNSTYKKVSSKTESGPDTDIVIVTGLRSGQTLAPSSSPKPTPSE